MKTADASLWMKISTVRSLLSKKEHKIIVMAAEFSAAFFCTRETTDITQRDFLRISVKLVPDNMLQKLSIQNYAIIDELEISFSPKLNVITGETGAGKSIIVGALGLILGERADTTVLVNKERKCIVEGQFRSENKKEVEQFLKKNELDSTDELVIRREIATNGKSRAFINDTPVTLSQLQELSSLLVDLHQQFATLELAGNDFQLDVIDALAGHGIILDEYNQRFNDWQDLKKENDDLRSRQLQFEKEADYNRFQFSELEEAAFKENELEETDTELRLLNNSEEIKKVLEKVNHALQESEEPVVQQLKVLAGQLDTFASYHPGLPQLVERMRSVQVELRDIAGDLSSINRQVNYDPAKIERLNDRLSLGYKLLKKHGVQATAELLVIQRQLEEKLQAVLYIDEAIRVKEVAMAKTFAEANLLAEKISKGRNRQVRPLQDEVNRLLTQVGMPNAQLRIKILESASLKENGKDEVEFLFDANKSGQFQPLRKVASGGELSRLMLCIKSLVAQSIDLPTMIFDEIDTGISGEAARQVGIIMKELAARRQVISITHQPQIAGKADAHFFVYKEIVKTSLPPGRDIVKTNIRLLSIDERITTIAKMLSGEKPTDAAMANARELLN